MPRIYNCEIGERVYYRHPVTGISRTGIVNSEPDEIDDVELFETGTITKVDVFDSVIAKWNLIKIEDALNDKEVVSQIKREAKIYGMTEEEYKKAIKLV